MGAPVLRPRQRSLPALIAARIGDNGRMKALAALVLASACSTSSPPAAPPSPVTTDAATIAEAAPRAWRALRIEISAHPAGAVTQAIELRASGAALLVGPPQIAPSNATAPAALLAQIDAWVANPPSLAAGTLDGAAYVARFTLDADRPLAAAFDAAHVPAPWQAILHGASALINTPRTAVRCLTWDGTGDFAIDVWAQDYGVAPGPLAHTRVDAVAATLAVTPDAAGATTTFALTPAEVDAIRVAMRAADLGAFPDVFGGAGEGANLRTVQLTTAAGPCARSFANRFPPALDRVLQALAPARERRPT